ncbi:MAG: hypothetical protein WD810_01580 [Solirubrobacterales bacterium]
MVARFACGAAGMATRPESGDRAARRAEILAEALAEGGKALRAQASRHARSAAEADDALQQACVEFLRFYEGEPGNHAIRYLMLAVKHSAWAIGSDAWSRHRSSVEVAVTDATESDTATVTVPCDRRGPGEQALASAEATAFSEALLSLKADERTALSLLAYGCSYQEIMALEGWTYTKVNRCLAEGRERLRELLAEE